MAAPLFDLLLVCHVASVLIGFGSVAVASLMARRARLAPSPATDDVVGRYFGPTAGADWPARLVFLVPVFGAALLVGQRGHHGYAGEVWPWIGLAIWIGAVGVITGRLWPAERSARSALLGLGEASAGDEDRAAKSAERVVDDASRLERFRDACQSMETAAAIATVCAVVAIVVMIWQPG